MEVCADGSGENDSHIINLMGSSDLNLVDTSMLPSDPRAMMDFVRSGDHDEESLSTSFSSTSFPSLSNNGQSSFPCSSNLTFSSMLSPITCSISLSASSVSSVERTSSSPLHDSPSATHSSALAHDLNNANPLTIPHRANIALLHQQLPLTSPPIPTSHQSPPYHQDVSSPPLDTSHDSSHHTPSPLHSMPPPLQTPPLHAQEFHNTYYSNSQISPSLAPSKTYQVNTGGYCSNGGYAYSPNSLQQQTSPPVLSPNEHQRKRTSRGSLVHPMKREPEEFQLESSKTHQALSPSELDAHDQPPYSAFGHLNIAGDETVNSSSLIQPGAGQRNHSGDSSTASPLLSPLRSPPCSSSANCSTPGDVTLVSRYPTNYIFSSPTSCPIILESSPNSSRLQNPPVLQTQQHQQTMFQPIQLHNPSGSQQQQGHLQHHDNLNLIQPQPLSISLSAYEESLHNDPMNSASRNLSFNYNDILVQHSSQPQHSLLYQQTPFTSKESSSKETRRRSSGAASGRLKGNEENLDNYSSDSDSDEDALVIDTSNASSEGYECGECKQVFRTRGNLRKHLATEHNTNEPEPAETVYRDYKCPVSGCNYVTKFRNEFDDHVSEHVAQGWTPTGKKRHNKNPLLRHRYNKEEFHCPHCEYSCTVEKAFNRHLAVHETPENDALFEGGLVSCVICGRDRPSEAALRIHMNKHRKGKKYKCDICNFVTVQLKKLIQHRRMHTGEKPHLCPFCVYRAARRDNLRSHVRRMHKKSNMYGDTFTPRPLIIAQVEATHGGRLQHPHSTQLPLMSLGQHGNTQQIPQHQNQALLDRLQQQPLQQPLAQQAHPQLQMSRGIMGQAIHQGLGISALSPQGIGGLSSVQDHSIHHQGLSCIPQHSPQSLLPSPPGQ